MELEAIKQQELRPDERDVLAQDGERWRRMSAGAHLDDWTALYPGLNIRRRFAMKLGHVNSPKGRGYAQAFGQLMAADGLHSMDKVTVSAVLWLGDDPERMAILREIREAMTPGQRSRLNSPISARQRIEQELKARNDPEGEPKPKASPLLILKGQVEEQNRQIAHLKEQLASAEQGFEYFNLKRDTAKQIASVLIANVGSAKAENIMKEMRAALKAKQRALAG